jgi:hypothetical protein
LKVNAGTAPERFYVKQGANNILFDTSWWQTAGSAYNQDDDEFVIHFAPGQQTVYRFSTLDSDLDGNNDNMSYHSGSGSSVTNFNGDPVSTKPAILNETIFSVVVESRSLFQFEGHYLKPLHFSLTSGDGDTDNNLFDLDTNGILKTATTFDYETNASTYSIRVQARDELNASMEGNFTVSLLDINEGPSDLNFTTPLAFAENQSVGSIVGEFNVTDPDVNSTLTYYMVAGAGDGNNSLFTLDSNGTLKTGTTFDYESNASTYSIRVQAKDEYNATVEGNFTVTLTDVYETPVQSRPIVYVRSTAGAGGDGQSWSTAYKHLRDALSNVLNGSDIWVAGGTHKPSASNSKTTYFTINSKDLRFFGGFAGNETSLSQRTLSSNETILSADYLGNDAEIYNSSAFSDNAYHVFVISDSNVTLSGLTIRGGNAKVANGEDSGGGINASNNSILIVESCKLESNYAVSYGGGISTTSNTILHMKNSILQNNYNGYNGGGGMSLWGGENEIFNSIFNNNDGSQVGAVLLHAGATSANFNNCLFVNNDGWSKRWAGAGALNLRTTSSVNNCTFYNNNFADSSAKGDLECTSTVTVTNSIFWHPTKNSNLVGGEGTLQLSHSIVKGGALGTSVSTQDPLFLNSSNLKGSDGLSFTNDDGFQLNHNSPAYNAGLPTSMLSDAVDLDQDGNVTEPTPFDLAGNSRVMGAVLDIGAYEFLTSNTTPTNLHPTAPLTVAENQPVGTAVGEFNATDPDVNATLTYYLVSGAGDGYNSLFTLETNGTLKTATTFDYETNASTYSIRVQAKDEYNATVEGNFTVTLIDVFDNQAPGAISIQFASLTENQPVGTVVGKLNAVDPEAGLVHYSLVNGLGAMGNKFFTVDPTGVLRTAVVFDFEQNASHSIRGRAMDEFNASREEVLNIQVSNQWEDPDGDGLENSYDPDDDNDGFSDIAEIAYGSDPLDPNSLPNRAPTQISLSSDRVEENMPIGTMVGQLRTIDFDDPNGSGVYQYSILTNATGAEFFSIDSNGTMLTKQKLDFESNSSHTIALQVTDNLGAHLDQNLTIQVVDAFIPIVETGDPVDVGFQEAMLSGKLLDKGSSMDLIQIGMLVSTDPNPNLNTKGIIRETGFLDANDRFEVMIMGLDKGQKYFYRTYAMNAEGVGYGVVKDFVMQEHASGPSWAKAQPGVAANWWTSPWFGSFYMNDGNAWIMHSELGWLYPMASGDKGVWLWMEQLGWLWTDEAFYPFLYQNSSAGWLYFYGASQDRLLFYHYRDERWFQKNKSNNF